MKNDEPQEILSSDFEWDTSRNEVALEENLELMQTEVFDVKLAKEILQAAPRPVEWIDVARYGEILLNGVGLKDCDWDRVDTRVPIILARDSSGRKFAIDGRHRVQKAINMGTQRIPAVSLSVEESAKIRVNLNKRTQPHIDIPDGVLEIDSKAAQLLNYVSSIFSPSSQLVKLGNSISMQLIEVLPEQRNQGNFFKLVEAILNAGFTVKLPNPWPAMHKTLLRHGFRETSEYSPAEHSMEVVMVKEPVRNGNSTIGPENASPKNEEMEKG